MGKWNGKTLIPEEYLKEATRKQIDTPEEKYPVCGYGYQYWITADHSFGVYGAFGNVIVVNPEKNWQLQSQQEQVIRMEIRTV